MRVTAANARQRQIHREFLGRPVEGQRAQIVGLDALEHALGNWVGQRLQHRVHAQAAGQVGERVRDDRNATMFADKDQGFDQRHAGRRQALDEQRDQVAFARRDLHPGDRLDPELRSQVACLQRAPDLVVVGHCDDVQARVGGLF